MSRTKWIEIHTDDQSETVQLLRGDASTSEEEHIRIMLAQVEIERVKFIVRSYVRTRLFKVSLGSYKALGYYLMILRSCNRSRNTLDT